jgi:hypothetical protein
MQIDALPCVFTGIESPIQVEGKFSEIALSFILNGREKGYN